MHAFLHQGTKVFQGQTEELKTVVENICKKEINDMQNLQTKLTELEAEKMECTSQNMALLKEIEALKKDNESLFSASNQIEHLRERCQLQEIEKTSLAKRVEELTGKLRLNSVESDQFRIQLRSKSQELDSTVMQLRSRHQSHQENVRRLQAELQEKIEEAENAHENYINLENYIQERNIEKEQIERQTSASIYQQKEMQNHLAKIQDELESLKIERELMIATHQNRIEQLRDSFKTKISAAEKWPQKIEEELAREKRKHSLEIASLEKQLNDNFTLEFQIEKQKHQELLDKNSSEYKSTDKKISQLQSLTNTQRSDIEELERRLQATKGQAENTEDGLRKEIKSLKNIIKDLEYRLGNLDSGNEALVLQLKNEVKEKERQLEEIKNDVNGLEEKILNMKEENDLLQDTVRRECEERFELTETLSEAREELLQLKKPAKGYSNPSSRMKSDSPVSAWSSSSEDSNLRSNSVSNLKQASSAGHLIPHPPLPSKELANTPNVTVGLESDWNKQQGKVKGGSVSDSRKRIAHAMGRK